MPPGTSGYKSIFGMTAKQHAAAMHARGVARGRPRRASASKGKAKEHKNPLLESQVPESALHVMSLAAKGTGTSTGAAHVLHLCWSDAILDAGVMHV